MEQNMERLQKKIRNKKLKYNFYQTMPTHNMKRNDDIYIYIY